jgi:predicted nucleotidyltransferase
MRDGSSRRTKADELLAEMVARLVRVYHPERIYLFGSMARGEAGPDSDYDILLIMPDDSPAQLLRPTRAYEALWGLEIGVDVHVWTRSKFESRLHLKASLPSTVIREGRQLYAA